MKGKPLIQDVECVNSRQLLVLRYLILRCYRSSSISLLLFLVDRFGLRMGAFSVPVHWAKQLSTGEKS